MIEVSKLAPQELRNYLKNAHRKGRTDIAKTDPERMWIDTYCAIKTSNVNDPEFQLHIDGMRTQSYNADRLQDALQ
jgi:hypothetical protein